MFELDTEKTAQILGEYNEQLQKNPSSLPIMPGSINLRGLPSRLWGMFKKAAPTYEEAIAKLPQEWGLGAENWKRMSRAKNIKNLKIGAGATAAGGAVIGGVLASDQKMSPQEEAMEKAANPVTYYGGKLARKVGQYGLDALGKITVDNPAAYGDVASEQGSNAQQDQVNPKIPQAAPMNPEANKGGMDLQSEIRKATEGVTGDAYGLPKGTGAPEPPDISKPYPNIPDWATKEGWGVSGKGGVTPSTEQPTAVRITPGTETNVPKEIKIDNPNYGKPFGSKRVYDKVGLGGKGEEAFTIGNKIEGTDQVDTGFRGGPGRLVPGEIDNRKKITVSNPEYKETPALLEAQGFGMRPKEDTLNAALEKDMKSPLASVRERAYGPAATVQGNTLYGKQLENAQKHIENEAIKANALANHYLEIEKIGRLNEEDKDFLNIARVYGGRDETGKPDYNMPYAVTNALLYGEKAESMNPKLRNLALAQQNVIKDMEDFFDTNQELQDYMKSKKISKDNPLYKEAKKKFVKSKLL